MGRAMHLHLPWTSPLILALGTWLVYVADRILDGLPVIPDARLRERHFFYARNRHPVLAAAATVSAVLLWLILVRMSPVTRREDASLFAVALLYFFVIHLGGKLNRIAVERWFPKEAAVALVFAAAVAVPAWSRVPEHRIELLPLAVMFALLCWLNCVAIEKWEHTHSSSAPAHFTTCLTARHLRLVSIAIAVLAAVAALRFLFFGSSSPMTALYGACAISAILISLLDRSPLDSARLRIAADAALLTPLLFLGLLC